MKRAWSVQAMAKESMNLPATAVSASSGHGRNQSMVAPLTRPGNCVKDHVSHHFAGP